VFRRRRRDGKDSSGAEPAEGYPAEDGEAGYPAYDEDEPDEYGPAGDDEADYAEAEYGEAEYGEAVDYGEAEDDGEAEPQAEPAAGQKAEREDLSDPATWTRLRDEKDGRPMMERSAGPWDSASAYPEAERIDFGSLLVPVHDGFDVQVFVSEEEGISIAVVHGDSGLQLQPFAAPRSEGLWQDVLPEIAQEVAKAGGQSTEQDGPFGRELLATVSPQTPDQQQLPPQPLRFMGADGPRWFLRGLISGPAATDAKAAEPFELIFADVVVVRGDHAEPPRKPLEIRLPQEAQEALEDQLAAQEPNVLNPFERGPEITETR
jgi:Protein of unknown function (DUF3710)